MEDADPETQALLIKLHRELNQLPTRAARRQTAQTNAPPSRAVQAKDAANKPKQRQTSRSPTPASTDGSPGKGQQRHKDDSHTDGSAKKKAPDQQQQGGGAPGARGACAHDAWSPCAAACALRVAAPGERQHAAHRGPPHHPLACKQQRLHPPPPPLLTSPPCNPPPQKKTKPGDQAAQERPAKRAKPSSKPTRSITPAESDQPGVRAKPEAAASPSQQHQKQRRQRRPQGAADTDGSNATHHEAPISAVAAAACEAVRQKVRQHGGSGAAAPRQVKCFHAGVRWGVTLPHSALQSRADLAAVLYDAFAGHILSCGRGDLLEVVVLDGSGGVTEFPSLRSGSGGGRESAQHWKGALERAAKVYVRPDRPPASLPL
jgi:hypothetical protein